MAKTELSSYTQTAPSSRRRQTPKCRQAPVRRAPDSVSVADLETFVDQWLFDGEGRHLSPRTLDFRRDLTQKLLWWLKREGHSVFGPDQVRGFLAYINTGHKEDGGRWGNPRMTRPVRPGTTHTYYVSLTTLCSFLVQEEVCEASPMQAIRPPAHRPDQIQPFTQDQVDALLKAARRSPNPKRDEAIVLFLLDTGARASEVCELTVGDVDMGNRQCRVLGKGDKHRSIWFSGDTRKALWRYLQGEPRKPDAPLFCSDSGTRAGSNLTRSGLLQLIERLGKAADVADCHPHRFRHTFAVQFLRNGGNSFTLQQLLGHTSITMTMRYVALAQADLENQHRQYSPVESLVGRGKARR
ncbi:MAG TPA: tyrosine-type recombinase/integrase [Armatimonadetes bacterium]|nr:tyrosine-type recombinase/integrase [Armatimonadota bacterium]